MLKAIKSVKLTWHWWHTCEILVLRRLRQKHCEFQASLGYVRAHLHEQITTETQAKTINRVRHFSTSLEQVNQREMHKGKWKAGPVVKSSCWSHRRLREGFQHPRGDSQPSLTIGSWGSNPLFWLKQWEIDTIYLISLLEDKKGKTNGFKTQVKKVKTETLN